MEMTGDKCGCFEHLIRGPPMAVKDADSITNHAGGGMHIDLAGEVGNDPHIVVPEHELYFEADRQYRGKEVEKYGPERPGNPDNRMLRIARDHNPRGMREGGRRRELRRQRFGRSFWQTAGIRPTGAQAQMQIRDDEKGFFFGTGGR
jgi:hypothetical protein